MDYYTSKFELILALEEKLFEFGIIKEDQRNYKELKMLKEARKG
jgi:hypothetical protein